MTEDEALELFDKNAASRNFEAIVCGDVLGLGKDYKVKITSLKLAMVTISGADIVGSMEVPLRYLKYVDS